MTKIEIEIDDALLARAEATGHTIQDIGVEGFRLAINAHDGERAMDEWMREQEQLEQTRANERAVWLADARPDIAASFKALRRKWGDRMEEERNVSLMLTVTQAAAFAWMELATQSWTKTTPFDQSRIDLDNPGHWQAAQEHARRALYQHYKKEWSALEGGTHPLLSGQEETGPTNTPAR